MKIYGMPLSTRVNKVRMCAHFLDIKYDYKHVNIYEKEQKKKSFLKMNIMGKIPTIDDNGYCLSESHAILRYLVGQYQDKDKAHDLYPSKLKKRCEVDRWLDYIAIELDDGINRILFNKFVAPKMGINSSERSIKEAIFIVNTTLPIIEKQLELYPFIAGECMTIADISLLSTLDPLEILEINISTYKTLLKWQEHMKSHAFYKQKHPSYKQAWAEYEKTL